MADSNRRRRRRSPHRSRTWAAALVLAAAAALLVGCGGGNGVQSGAVVHLYVAAPLCAEVQRELGTGKVGDVTLRAVCLTGAKRGAHTDLATTGADARRATEDSTAVAFVEASGPGAKFAAPIVEGAGIAFLETGSGAAAAEQVERAIGEAGDGASLREELAKALR